MALAIKHPRTLATTIKLALWVCVQEVHAQKPSRPRISDCLDIALFLGGYFNESPSQCDVAIATTLPLRIFP